MVAARAPGGRFPRPVASDADETRAVRFSDRNLWPIALFGLCVFILLGLLVADQGKSRFDDCMGIGAFTKSECEAYARE